MSDLATFLTGTTLIFVIAVVAMVVLAGAILWWNRYID
jgi:hypothetical protein